MYTLGINYLSESSVCLFKNNRLIYAISEERLNRIKNWYGIPYKSIKQTLKDNALTIKDIDNFASHGLSALTLDTPNKNSFNEKIQKILQSKLSQKKKKFLIKKIKQRQLHEKNVIEVRTKNIIKKLKQKYNNIKIFDHHTAHAASAYYFSNFKKCYVLTIDGWGDNASAKLFSANNGSLVELKRTETIDSLGYFYGSFTKLLGFTPQKHEGKVLGLAAYADPKIAMKDVNKIIRYNKRNKNFEGLTHMGLYLPTFHNNLLNFLKKKYTKSEIAAAVQHKLEEVVIAYINDIDGKNFDLALAGGVFANVKLNQKIQEHKKVKNIYIFPNMGDGGLSIGAAALCLNKLKKYKKFKVQNMYLGPSYSNSEVLKQFKKFNLKKIEVSKQSKYIAGLLNSGKVIALYQNRMEFGPRALCNRSIICAASDHKINKILNKKLGRTEFMPFAPVLLKNEFKNLFFPLEKKHKNSHFMTMTFNCKKKSIKKAPAIVHVDKTARPQIIEKKDNLRIYDILTEYKKLTGIAVLVNTSFNLHEEPIVCSINDAFRAFKASKLDYLVIGNNIFSHK